MIIFPTLQRIKVGNSVQLLRESHNGYISPGRAGRVTEINNDPIYFRVDDGFHTDWVKIDNLKIVGEEKFKPIKGLDVADVHYRLAKNNFGFPDYNISFFGHGIKKSDLNDVMFNLEYVSFPIDVRRDFDELAHITREGKSIEGMLVIKNRQNQGMFLRFPKENYISIPFIGVYPESESRDFVLERMVRLCAVDSFFEDRHLITKLWKGYEDLGALEKLGFEVTVEEEGFYRNGDSRLTLRYDPDEENTREHIAHLTGDKK